MNGNTASLLYDVKGTEFGKFCSICEWVYINANYSFSKEFIPIIEYLNGLEMDENLVVRFTKFNRSTIKNVLKFESY